MATPVNFQPPQPYTPGQSSVSTPPAAETALVLNINSPLINHGSGVAPTNPQACAAPASDLFQRKTNAPFTPNPSSSPAQQLQDAYANALTVRNDAEQARTNFLNLASQLENQALSNPAQATAVPPQAPVAPVVNPFTQSAQPLQPATPAPAPTFQAPAPPAPQPDPTQQFQQQLQALQQQQPQTFQPQQPAYDPMAQQQMMQQPPMMDPMQQQMLQQQMMQQQAQMQQPPMMDPMQQQMLQQQMMQQQAQMQQPPMMAGANINDLNTMIAQPRTLDEKLNALNAIAVNQIGDRQTYELLKQEVANSMQGVPPEAANAIRQAALIALGSLNGSQVNARVPGNQLYGMDAIKQILTNKNENALVQASAVAALGYMNRPQDPAIQGLLKLASKNNNPDVKNAVAQVNAGQMVAPTQAGQATPAA